jgi:hypothetical protein
MRNVIGRISCVLLALLLAMAVVFAGCNKPQCGCESRSQGSSKFKNPRGLLDFPFGAGGFRLTNKDKEDDNSITAWLDGQQFTPPSIRKGGTGTAPSSETPRVKSVTLMMRVGDDGRVRSKTFSIAEFGGVCLKEIWATYEAPKVGPYSLDVTVTVYTTFANQSATSTTTKTVYAE